MRHVKRFYSHVNSYQTSLLNIHICKVKIVLTLYSLGCVHFLEALLLDLFFGLCTSVLGKSSLEIRGFHAETVLSDKRYQL
jgi:hypothetical protein